MTNKINKKVGFTIVELLVTIIIVGILASMAIAMQGGALTTAKKKQCSGNFQNLYKGLFTYVALYGGARQSPPSEIGSELWVKLCTDPTDVLEQDNAGKDAKILQCPIQNDEKGPDYRGPNVAFSKMKKYLGCDIDGNHGENKGGYALLKSGATTELTGDDWQKVLDETLFNTTVSNQEKEVPVQNEEELKKELKRAEETLSAKLNVLKYEIDRMKKATSELEESMDERAISEINEIAEDMVKATENVKKAKEEIANIKDALEGKSKKIVVTRKMKANQEDAAGFLKQITSHEAVWQRVDEDGNAIKDYYTFDVAGLHYHTNMLGSKLQYIDIKSAKADPSVTNWDANAKCEPMNGYYFKAMVRGGDGANYNKNLAVRAVGPITAMETLAFNPDRYGFCAYPAEYGKTGVMTFLVNQAGVRYQKDIGGKPIDQWPCKEGEDPTAKDGWEVVD